MLFFLFYFLFLIFVFSNETLTSTSKQAMTPLRNRYIHSSTSDLRKPVQPKMTIFIYKVSVKKPNSTTDTILTNIPACAARLCLRWINLKRSGAAQGVRSATFGSTTALYWRSPTSISWKYDSLRIGVLTHRERGEWCCCWPRWRPSVGLEYMRRLWSFGQCRIMRTWPASGNRMFFYVLYYVISLRMIGMRCSRMQTNKISSESALTPEYTMLQAFNLQKTSPFSFLNAVCRANSRLLINEGVEPPFEGQRVSF